MSDDHATAIALPRTRPTTRASWQLSDERHRDSRTRYGNTTQPKLRDPTGFFPRRRPA